MKKIIGTLEVQRNTNAIHSKHTAATTLKASLTHRILLHECKVRSHSA